MMKNIYKAFARKIFGVRYERIGRALLTELILFLSLHTAGLRIGVAPSVLYLMTASFTAGIMWQALSSTDNRCYLKHMLMLPFDGRTFTLAYIGVLASYTLITKTAMLWAVVFAVSSFTAAEIFISFLCALCSILITSYVFALKNRRPVIRNLSGITGLLRNTDPYYFYRQTEASQKVVTVNQKNVQSIWMYFFRYLAAHRNYLINTAALCGIAWVLPLFFEQTDSAFALPVGFAILSMNTPLCILLSCDPALEQAVRLLPGQKKAFCIPYVIFLFAVNLLTETVFLCSLAVHCGNLSVWWFVMAGYFALQSAAASVWLEWFHPIRNWKIESDLWHHPRKYIVPGTMVLIAGLIGAVS